MKAKFLYLVIIFSFNSIFAQDYNKDIQGRWITVFKEMKDGSKYIPRSCNPFPDKFIFTNNKFCINKVDNLCFDFVIKKDFIETSENSGYKIEKLSSDSLTIVQSMKGNDEEDKLERIYLVKEEKVFEQQKKNHSEKSIVASGLFFPPMKQNLTLALNTFFKEKRKFSNFNLIGAIIIYPLEKKIITEIKYSSKEDKERIGYIKEIINNSFNTWDLKHFQTYESVTLPFVLESKEKDVGDGYTYRGISIYFLSQNINDFECVNGIPYKTLKKSGELFSKGIDAINKESYEKAISFFNESYLLDKSKIDNLYNIASVYTLKGDTQNACNTLKKLDDLSQIQGRKLFEEKCKK